MTLRHMDGMALYDTATTATAVGKLDSASSSFTFRSSGAFGAGSYAVAIGPGTINNVAYDCTTKPWYTSTSTIVFGLRFKMTGSFVNTRAGVAFVKSDGTNGWTLACNGSGGGLAIWLNSSTGSTSTVLGGTYTATVNVWDYHEFKFIPAATDGTHRLIWKVNGTQVYDSGATLTLGGTAFGRIQLGGAGSTNTIQSAYSDLYICDGAGSVNNNFLGDIRVETLYPTADGSHGDFTIGNGLNLLTTNEWGLETGSASGAWALCGSTERTAIGTALGTTPTATSGTVAASNSSAYEGTYSLLVNCPTSAAFQTPAGTSGIAVSPSTAYSWALRVNSPATANQQGGGILWYDSSGTFISVSTPGYWANTSSTPWAGVGGTATSPSNAAYAAVFVQTNWNGTNNFYDTIGFYQNSVGIQFRAPGTAHYLSVNDIPHDSDYSCVVTSTVGATDSYALADLNSTAGTPVAVLATSVVRKETPTPRTASNLLRLSATDYVGTAFTVNNDLAYHGMTTIWETNPATSTTWTISNVNALEAGIQLES